MNNTYIIRDITMPEKLITPYIKSMKEDEYRGRMNEGMMYGMDFDASNFNGIDKLKYKDKTQEEKQALLNNYLETATIEGGSGATKAVIYGDQGYVGYKIGFVKDINIEKVTGKVILATMSEAPKKFNKIKDLKDYVESLPTYKQQEIYGTRVLNSQGFLVGRISIIETMTYKSKPKACPKKYTAVDKLVNVVIFGQN